MWWEYVIIVAVLALGIYGFLTMVGFETRMLSRHTDRAAESMYTGYAGLTRRQRRSARQHGGQSGDQEHGGQ
jgi:hypothetical protein